MFSRPTPKRSLSVACEHPPIGDYVRRRPTTTAFGVLRRVTSKLIKARQSITGLASQLAVTMPPKRAAQKRRAPPPPVTRGAKKAAGSDRSSAKAGRAKTTADARQAAADAQAADDADRAAEQAQAEYAAKVKRATITRKAAADAVAKANKALVAAAEAAANVPLSAAEGDGTDPEDEDLSTPAPLTADESLFEAETEPIRSASVTRTPSTSAGRIRADSPKATVSYKRALALVREYDPDQDVDDWIMQFNSETDGLPIDDKVSVFRLKIHAKCADWYYGELRNDPTRTLSSWLRCFGDQYRHSASQRLGTLRQRQQKEGEDAGAFVRAVVALCLRYNPRMSEEEKLCHIADNVHPKFQRAFNGMNVHATTVKMTETSLRAAMQMVEAQSKAVRFAGAVKVEPTEDDGQPDMSRSTPALVGRHVSRRESYENRSPPPAIVKPTPTPPGRRPSSTCRCRRSRLEWTPECPSRRRCPSPKPDEASRRSQPERCEHVSTAEEGDISLPLAMRRGT